MWGGAIKIGARPFWGRGVFVLVISNINIGFQKSLTPPLSMISIWIFERLGPTEVSKFELSPVTDEKVLRF